MVKINRLLDLIYGRQIATGLSARIQTLLALYRPRIPTPKRSSLTQQDSILITYADQVQEVDIPPLETLADFCRQRVAGLVSGIHILPFYPWTSDDGFSVVDYRAVEPAYGDWDDLLALNRDFRLMFDAVINHISADSAWFREFLRGDPRYSDFFIVIDGNPDLSQVVRPRALPLLTHVKTYQGEKAVWTTFSTDQVDLNYANPDVLMEILDILLGYVVCGAEFIRLDAIAYLWKQLGTSCIHLPQTHQLVQLIRAVLDEVAPHVRLITETNVPHPDNISYFGNGYNEAQLVYNFALPPLVLHAFLTGTAETLTRWAETLVLPSDKTTFFNFLASHDGIGLNPLRGLIPEAEIESLVKQIQAHGGLVSYKNNPDQTKAPYELNVNYFDALNNPNSDEAENIQIERFVTAHAILLALVGVPGIYFHSLFGSRGWPAGVQQTGRSRTINRQKFQRQALETELDAPGVRRQQVFSRLSVLLKTRSARAAFDPFGVQKVLAWSVGIFSLLRIAPDGSEQVLCLHNVTPESQELGFRPGEIFLSESNHLTDLLTAAVFPVNGEVRLHLAPYQTLWLAPAQTDRVA